MILTDPSHQLSVPAGLPLRARRPRGTTQCDGARDEGFSAVVSEQQPEQNHSVTWSLHFGDSSGMDLESAVKREQTTGDHVEIKRQDMTEAFVNREPDQACQGRRQTEMNPQSTSLLR